jgi:CO dehydrogenase maturation factor
MKIAFVGKGGSGKSTIASLFIKHLIDKKDMVLVIDADINMHMAGLLGVPSKSDLAISEHGNPAKIREILVGTNSRVKSIRHVVKTTPPATGSHLLTITAGDKVLKDFSTPFAERGHFMTVGTYNEEEIGTACYHTNLSILENVLSHTMEKEGEWVVVDMVAGTDAFSGSLHIQFDAIFLIVEPTPESTSVFTQYKKLATKAGMFDRVFVIGNKIQDEADMEYLKGIVEDKLVGYIPVLSTLKRARQQNRSVDLSDITDRVVFANVEEIAKKNLRSAEQRLKDLYELHKKHIQQEWVVKTLGDLQDQVDPLFRP